MFRPAGAGPQKMVTANRLSDGLVVFVSPLAADGAFAWVRDLAAGGLFSEGAELAAAIAFGAAGEKARLVVEPYPIDIVFENGQPIPARLRERIRALGPTVDYGAAERARLEAAPLAAE